MDEHHAILMNHEITGGPSGEHPHRGDKRMTMMVGGNLEQLQALEHNFTTEAQAVADLQRRITSTLANTTWTGPAADRFRSEWNGTFVPALGRLQQALVENSTVVRNRKQAIQVATS